jgi:hypothetical protein
MTESPFGLVGSLMPSGRQNLLQNRPGGANISNAAGDRQMQSDASQPRLLRVSTRDLPALDRMPFWREAFARQMCRLEFEPLFDAPLDVEGALLALPV